MSLFVSFLYGHIVVQYINLHSKQIRMCASVKHQQGEARVVLLPDEQPVRLDVALPRQPAFESRHLVRTVLLWQGAFYAENIDQFGNLIHVKPALDAPLDGTLELRGVINRVHRSVG